MTTEHDQDDPYLRPYQPDPHAEVEFDDDDDSDDADDEETIEAIDLEEAAAEFRMRYYGPDNNPAASVGHGRVGARHYGAGGCGGLWRDLQPPCR